MIYTYVNVFVQHISTLICLEIGTAVTHARCFWLFTWLPGAKFTTQALLLVDSQSGQTLEFTTDACAWQMKTENGWRPVQPQVLSSLDAWTMPGWGVELSHPTCWGSMGMVQVGTINGLPTRGEDRGNFYCSHVFLDDFLPGNSWSFLEQSSFQRTFQ